MRHLMLPFAVAAAILAVSDASRADGPPPEGAKPLSEILRTVEARPDFRYFDEVELDDGVYEIKYYTRDNARKKIRIDPVTGNQR